MNIDIDKLSFEQFIIFVFDHPVEDIQNAWYRGIDEWEWCDDSTVFEHLLRLFRNPAFLLERYTNEQLDQGFWFIKGPCCGFLENTLWNPDIPWSIRKELIDAMGDLYEKLFAINSLDTSSNMWWHTLANDYTSMDGSDIISRGMFPNDPIVQQAIFETLCRIIKLPSRDCQWAALHGMGHLRHPDTVQVITKYLENLELDEAIKNYAQYCMSGERIQ